MVPGTARPSMSHLISRLNSDKDFSEEETDLQEFAGGAAAAAVFAVEPAATFL